MTSGTEEEVSESTKRCAYNTTVIWIQMSWHFGFWFTCEMFYLFTIKHRFVLDKGFKHFLEFVRGQIKRVQYPDDQNEGRITF